MPVYAEDSPGAKETLATPEAHSIDDTKDGPEVAVGNGTVKTSPRETDGEDSKDPPHEDDETVYVKGHPVIRNGNSDKHLFPDYFSNWSDRSGRIEIPGIGPRRWRPVTDFPLRLLGHPFHSPFQRHHDALCVQADSDASFGSLCATYVHLQGVHRILTNSFRQSLFSSSVKSGPLQLHDLIGLNGAGCKRYFVS